MQSDVRILGATDNDTILLVDDADVLLGTAPKLEAHRRGLQHRAVSALVRNPRGMMLLQRRAPGKYHSEGLWTNACCGHPRPSEGVDQAAARRLGEEMGFACPLEEFGTITYRAELDQGLVEHEYVHVFRGTFDGEMALNPDEVCDVVWMTPEALLAAFDETPEIFTAWFVKYMRAGWPLDRPL